MILMNFLAKVEHILTSVGRSDNPIVGGYECYRYWDLHVSSMVTYGFYNHNSVFEYDMDHC